MKILQKNVAYMWNVSEMYVKCKWKMFLYDNELWGNVKRCRTCGKYVEHMWNYNKFNTDESNERYLAKVDVKKKLKPCGTHVQLEKLHLQFFGIFFWVAQCLKIIKGP